MLSQIKFKYTAGTSPERQPRASQHNRLPARGSAQLREKLLSNRSLRPLGPRPKSPARPLPPPLLPRRPVGFVSRAHWRADLVVRGQTRARPSSAVSLTRLPPLARPVGLLLARSENEIIERGARERGGRPNYPARKRSVAPRTPSPSRRARKLARSCWGGKARACGGEEDVSKSVETRGSFGLYGE